MRFIIHELPYEVPIASGELRYFADGQPTGAVEKWRLTKAADGHRFIRVDLDARFAPSGRSYLFHQTVDSLNQPIQLKFRYWKSNQHIIGNVLIEHNAVIVTRNINGHRYDDILHQDEGFLFWFPSTIGLSLLSGIPDIKDRKAISLNTFSDQTEHHMVPFATKVSLRMGEQENIKIMGEEKTSHPLNISWADQRRTIWLDKDNWPIQMQRQDGLLARESRHLSYQQIIKPDPNQGLKLENSGE